MSKHTPGPWRISGESATTIQADHRAINSEHGVIIASAQGHPNSGYFPDEKQAAANARLIAAAPELLEVLQDAIALYGKFGAIVNDPHNPGEWITKAKEAVRRATE